MHIGAAEMLVYWVQTRHFSEWYLNRKIELAPS